MHMDWIRVYELDEDGEQTSNISNPKHKYYRKELGFHGKLFYNLISIIRLSTNLTWLSETVATWLLPGAAKEFK